MIKKQFIAKEIPKNSRIQCEHFVIGNQKLKSENYVEIINNQKIFLLNQHHTDNIKHIDEIVPSEKIDGVYTFSKNEFLGIKTADCAALVIWPEKSDVVLALHAGFRGVLGGIIEKGVNTVKKYAPGENINVYIAPHIQNCCYEVSKATDNRVQKFKELFGNNVIIENKKGIFIDLRYAITKILEKQKVQKQHVYGERTCTACKESFPSHYKSTFIQKTKRDTVLLTIARLR